MITIPTSVELSKLLTIYPAYIKQKEYDSGRIILDLRTSKDKKLEDLTKFINCCEKLPAKIILATEQFNLVEDSVWENFFAAAKTKKILIEASTCLFARQKQLDMFSLMAALGSVTLESKGIARLSNKDIMALFAAMRTNGVRFTNDRFNFNGRIQSTAMIHELVMSLPDFVTEIVLGDSSFDDNTAQPFTDCLAMPNIRTISFSVCRFTESGMAIFARALRDNTTLTSLQIDKCNVSNQMFGELVSALETNRGLQHLGISGNYNARYCDQKSELENLQNALIKNTNLRSLAVNMYNSEEVAIQEEFIVRVAQLEHLTVGIYSNLFCFVPKALSLNNCRLCSVDIAVRLSNEISLTSLTLLAQAIEINQSLIKLIIPDDLPRLEDYSTYDMNNNDLEKYLRVAAENKKITAAIDRLANAIIQHKSITNCNVEVFPDQIRKNILPALRIRAIREKMQVAVWQEIAPSLAFVRANSTSKIRTSILALLPSIVNFSETPKYEQTPMFNMSGFMGTGFFVEQAKQTKQEKESAVGVTIDGECKYESPRPL